MNGKKELMSVTEICKKTGLNRKNLFDFKDIVHPSSYSTNGYYCRDHERNGHDVRGYNCSGHGQYDQAALDKFILIRLLLELEMSKKEIKNIFNSPNFNFNVVLNEQINRLKNKRDNYDKLIELAEGIEFIGIKDSTLLSGILLSYNNSEYTDSIIYKEIVNKLSNLYDKIDSIDGDMEKILDGFILELFKLKKEGLSFSNEKCINIVDDLEETLKKYSIDSILMFYVIILFLAGGGNVAQEINSNYDQNTSDYIVNVIFEKLFINMMKEINLEVAKICEIPHTNEENEDVQMLINKIHSVFIKYILNPDKTYFLNFFKAILNDNINLPDNNKKFVYKAICIYCYND